jgi:hypothetical protein
MAEFVACEVQSNSIAEIAAAALNRLLISNSQKVDSVLTLGNDCLRQLFALLFFFSV